MKSNGVIFMYHRVLPKEMAHATDISVQAGMYVTPASLRLHLSYLKARFTIIPLSELVKRLEGGEDVSHCAVITFDDGWWDNYLYAFPILKELEVPATIFLASGFIGTSRWFWPEEIGWAVLAAHRKKIDSNLLPEPLLEVMNRKALLQLEVNERIDHLIADLKSWEEAPRLSVAKSCALLREKTTGESERLLMNWDEVREMSESGLVSFGAHTVSHALLDQLPLDQVQKEIVECAADIHSETGLSPELFAYPNGNYTERVFSLLAAAGITAAVTTKRGLVNRDSQLFELPRIAVHEDISHTQALFQWRLFVR